MTAHTIWAIALGTVALLTIGGVLLTLAGINAALIASRPISHKVDGSCCGGGRR